MKINSDKPAKLDFNEKVKSFFDELVESIRTDQLMMETSTAPREKHKIYKSLILGEETELAAMSRAASSMHFIKNLLLDYISELKTFKTFPLKLALDLSDAKVLVWAEIEDGDERTEDALILSEAKANARYSGYGFHITSTIVEHSDNMPVPPHYQNLAF